VTNVKSSLRFGLEMTTAPLDFDSFFDDHFDPIARWSGLLVQDRALGEDIAQETMSRLFAKWPTFRTIDHARNYAYKTALHLAQRTKTRLRIQLRALSQSSLDPQADMSDEITARLDVMRALAKLTAKERACLLLVDFVGLDTAEVADIVGGSAGAMRVTLHRARSKVRRSIQERTE
jgi:RNA polymerase sigma-70 factor, ECF subfamily